LEVGSRKVRDGSPLGYTAGNSAESKLKRISNNRALFEADPGETITVTVEATKTPYDVTFSPLESGGQWKTLQEPTPEQPVEKRQFKMPATVREFYTITYGFPPAGQTDPDAKYSITFSGAGGTGDGPKDVLPPAAGNERELPYEFRLPGTT